MVDVCLMLVAAFVSVVDVWLFVGVLFECMFFCCSLVSVFVWHFGLCTA